MMKTDSQLQNEVMSELAWEPSVHASQIGVAVSDGIVTLAGHVGSYAEKCRVELAAQSVSGVKGLVVDIHIVLPGHHKRNDDDIARAAENILQSATYLPKGQIKITVEGGWITLAGEVDWHYQKEAAIAAVRDMIGVNGVSNSITLGDKTNACLLKSDIEAAFKRRAQTDWNKISVGVNGAAVTLGGTISTYSERTLIIDAVWSAPGVNVVVDNMTIAY